MNQLNRMEGLFYIDVKKELEIKLDQDQIREGLECLSKEVGPYPLGISDSPSSELTLGDHGATLKSACHVMKLSNSPQDTLVMSSTDRT